MTIVFYNVFAYNAMVGAAMQIPTGVKVRYTETMKLILAQGNPGLEYAGTRHNVGFLALDALANSRGATFQHKAKFHADIAELSQDGEKILLVKPTTFYNETGVSARAIADFYKIVPTDIIVLHDELALPFGTLRTREKGSDAGNNGIKSLNAHLGQNFARIRIGVWTTLAERMPATDFVLGRFSADEHAKLANDIIPKIHELLHDFIRGTHRNASHSL